MDSGEIKNNTQAGMIISIIIANYNARELLRNCLESIYKYPSQFPYEIIVVDDGSKDDSWNMVRENFPQVRLLRNEENLHYARSNNRALELACGRYVYLLNSDTLMRPDALDKMVEFLDTHPRVGAVGNKLLNEDGSIQASVKVLPSLMAGLFGARSIITKMFPNNPFSSKHLLHLSEDMTEPFKAGYVSSASTMIRREVVEQVGGLDPRLSYHVDADYCARIWEAGWDVYYLPDAVVVHLDHRGGTLANPMRRFKSVVEFHYGSFIYYQKHQMKSIWHPMTLVVVLGLSARFVVSLVLLQTQEFIKYFR